MIVGVADGFVGVADGFVGVTDGFVGVADGFVGVADGFVAVVDGFVAVADGFVAVADGFVAVADGFVAVADGFVGVADGFAGVADGFVGVADVIVSVADVIFFAKVQASCLQNRLFASKRPILTSGGALHKVFQSVRGSGRMSSPPIYRWGCRITPYRECVKRTTELSLVAFSRPLCGLNLSSALIPSSQLLGYCHPSASRTELPLTFCRAQRYSQFRRQIL